MAAQKETHEQKIARLGLTYYLPDTTYYPDHILRRYNTASRDAYNAYVRNAYADSTQQAYNAKDEILSRYDRARHRLENLQKLLESKRKGIIELATYVSEADDDTINDDIQNFIEAVERYAEIRHEISDVRRDL